MTFLKATKTASLMILASVSFFNKSFAQNTNGATAASFSLIDNLNPATPTVHQFTKYTDLPVSEYTGVPDISVPLYEIDEDGVKVPLSLTYHAGGIRVNEEASWVGLGWDMTVGSIVQTINDQDDFAAPSLHIGILATEVHLQSDYINTGTPLMYPAKYNYCTSYVPQCVSPCNNTVPVNAVIAADGAVVYTGGYAPFNGNYTQQDPSNYFDDHFYYNVDSEPDIFSVNFLGHSFKFIVQWNPERIVVLDKRGYNVARVGNAWTVVVPSGEEYVFATKDSVLSYSNSGSLATPGGVSSIQQPSSNVYMLSKIITKNKKVITFNYTQTTVQNCYPSFSQKGIVATLGATWNSGNANDIISFCRSTNVGPSSITGTNLNSTNYSVEPYTYLSSITFPKGTVNFNLSSRNDITGGLKLDSLSVNSTQQIKSYHFNYSYFDATSVTTNTFTSFNTAGIGSTGSYRLKLLSIVDNGGATYTFSYNTTPLPARNSFATDYWGYYNGATFNTTFIPNATQFNQSGWVTNNDNHSANLTYAQAEILQQIKYPTGGTVNFTYALNQFNNYWVPDYSSNTNTVSSGNGLRVQAITWNDINGNQLKQTNYTYSGGMASIPVNFFRSYVFGTVAAGNLGPNQAPAWNSYNINETNVNGLFTSNPFASFNGVGYNQVIKTDVDNNNNFNGKTVSNYYNQPDMVYNSIGITQQIDPTMPAYKNPADTAENGSLKSELYYDNSNNLLKKVTNTYSKVMSQIYYGARVMGYGAYVNYSGDGGQGGYNQAIYGQNMVCYYPVFDFETLPFTTTETNYFGSDALSTTKSNFYDGYNQVSQTQQDNSDGTITNFNYSYPYSNNPAPGTVFANMMAANRLSDVIGTQQVRVTPFGTLETINSFTRSYKAIGNLFVASRDTVINNVGAGTNHPSMITYDQYDSSNGNILQYSKNGVPAILLWDYNKEYVTADAKNAVLTNVAYTSFEADGTGRWKFTGTSVTDSKAPTGTKAYSLANGNIYRDSLDATQTYIVSYWSKNGVQTVSGSSAVKQGYSYNGYTYFEHTVIAPSAGTITISGTGTIDELRLYPNTAQMTSYTYQPLVGISSEDSPGGKISYYQYDSSQRLINVIDQYGNIIKHMSYHYQGQ